MRKSLRITSFIFLFAQLVLSNSVLIKEDSSLTSTFTTQYHPDYSKEDPYILQLKESPIQSENEYDSAKNNQSSTIYSVLKSITSPFVGFFNFIFSSYLGSKILFLIGSGTILLKFEGVFVTFWSTLFMFILSFISDVFAFIRPLYSFLLPVFATLAIFQFSIGYTDVLITSLLCFFKGDDNGMKLSMVMISLFIFVPFLLGFLFTQEEKIKKSTKHHWVFVLAAFYVSVNFNLYQHGSQLLKTLSSNQNSGYLLKTVCLFASGILKTLQYFFKDSLNIIFRIITFFVSLEIITEIYGLVLSFSKS